MFQNRTRPFLPVFPLLALGIYLSQFAAAASAAWAGAVLTPLWLWLEFKGRGSARYLFWLLLIAAGCLLAATDAGYLPECDQPLALTGRVLDCRPLSYNQRVIVFVPELKARLALHLPLDLELILGDRLWFRGHLEKPSRTRNPGEFDYQAYLRSQGVYAVMEPFACELLPRKASAALALASLQARFKANLERHMQNPGLAAALVLGDRSALSPEQLEVWEQLGITHLLAVSGTHIGLFAAALWLALRWVPFSKNSKTVAVCAVLLFYVLLSGAKPSAWRAWLAAVIAAGGAGRRQLDGLHVWSLIGTAMLVANPLYLWQIGFQLSFAASGGIILWRPLIKKLAALFPQRTVGRWLGRIFSAIAVSIVAQLSLVPLILRYFSNIALLAPAATLLMVPLAAALMVGGMFLGVFGSLAAYLGSVLDVVAGLADWLCRLLARADCNVAAPPMPANWALAWYLAFAGIGWIGRRQYIRIGAPTVRRWVNWGLVAMLAVSVPHQFARPLEITFLDVGQGDCILIRTPFRQHILVDGGGDSVYWQERGRNVGMTTVVPYLRHRGVRHIDLVISSHPHEDHLHGLLAVLEHFSVGMIIDSGQTHTSPTYRKYLELIMEKRIPYQRLRAGDQVLLRGGVSLSILHPHQFLSGTGSDLNNNSLVIRLAYQGRSVLLTGDIDREGLEDLLKRGGLTPVDLVKVPHHGSRAALVPEFYQVVQPRHAVISVGRNSFGHPHPDVLGFLELSGITALRTDQEGAVSFYIWNGLFGRYSQAR